MQNYIKKLNPTQRKSAHCMKPVINCMNPAFPQNRIPFLNKFGSTESYMYFITFCSFEFNN